MVSEPRWTVAQIPWKQLCRERVADDEALFYAVSTASLIEITTDLYTRNLVQHFAGDDEVCTWLARGWEPEELQHGRALREYVLRAWPTFDWDAVYAAFFAEYGALCKPEALMPRRSLELVSRCVVEMGTSSFYTALHGATGEPVLKYLTRCIYQDEIGHYRHFYRYFLRYRDIEGVNRAQVLGALWHRLKLIQDEDSYIALKHVYAARHPGARFDRRVYRRVVKRCRGTVGRYLPHRRSVKMLLKPLDMPALAQRVIQPVMESVARYVAA